MSMDALRAADKADLRKQQGGYVLLVALAVLAGILTLGLSMMHNATSGRKIMTESRKGSQSRYAAESAISLLINRTANSVDSNGYLVEFPSTTLNVYGHRVVIGMDVEQDAYGKTRVDSIRSKYDLLTFRSYGNVDAIATDTVTGSSAHIRQRIAFDQYPLFQFAIYWEGVMLLDPGSPMSITGRVHCNSRIKLFPGNTLSIEDWITSPCEMWHKSGGGSSRIRMMRIDNVLGGYRVPPSGFTAVDTPYYSYSKRAKVAYGAVVPVFKMPIGTRNPILVIQPKGVSDLGVSGFTETMTTKRQKFVYKADLIYRKRNASGTITKQWYRNNTDGTDYTVSSAFNTSLNTAIDTPSVAGNHKDSLYEFGDQKWMNATYVNMGKFFTASTDPADVVLYLEGQWNESVTPKRRDVFVLYNGATFNRNLTIVSNCPVYIWNKFNCRNSKSAAVIGDLITAMSPTWKPTYQSDSTMRGGSDDSVYACLMGGVHQARVHPNWNTVTDPDYYNWNQDDNASFSDRIGQPHNHMSFFEDLTGTTFTYRGSMVALWRCLYITGLYRFNPGNNVYSQPTRNYGFDPRYNNLKNMPPGTPTMISPFNLDYYEVHEE
jgi:hypothetical protein